MKFFSTNWEDIIEERKQEGLATNQPTNYPSHFYPFVVVPTLSSNKADCR